MKVVREGYPDSTAFDPETPYYDPKSDPDNPRWYMVDVQYVRHLNRKISLRELKQNADALEGLALIRKGNRLSIMPVTKEQWDYILDLE
jgi:predicted RNA-binding protein with PUA-like domain